MFHRKIKIKHFVQNVSVITALKCCPIIFNENEKKKKKNVLEQCVRFYLQLDLPVVNCGTSLILFYV